MKYIKFLPLLSLSLVPHFALAKGGDTTVGIGIMIFFVIIAILYIVFFAFAILMFIFWVMMLVDVAQRANWENENDKTVWILVVVLAGGIGAVIYYFMIKRKLGPNRNIEK